MGGRLAWSKENWLLKITTLQKSPTGGTGFEGLKRSWRTMMGMYRASGLRNLLENQDVETLA